MSSLATRRLIEASSSLEPADRALLNLWVHRGLDDVRLAQLTGMSADAVMSRRARIVTQLSEELGLPETDIAVALSQIEPAAPSVNGAGCEEEVEPSPQVEARRPESRPKLEASASGAAVAAARPEPELRSERRLHAVPPLPPEAPAPPPPPAPEARPSRRRWWAAIAGVVVLAIAVTLVIVLSSGSSDPQARSTPTSPPAPTSPSSTAPATTATTTTTMTTAASGSATASTPAAASAGESGAAVGSAVTRLEAFPGGLKTTTGKIVLAGHSPHLKLKLTVKHLPTLKSGHYEVWLFNSVVDDQRLGAIASGNTTLTFPLPPGARHYRWIDITLQPRGSHSYSGESKLRAHNPVDGPKSVLHAHRARVPKKLTHTQQSVARKNHASRHHHGAKQKTKTHHAAKHRHAAKHTARPAAKRRTAGHS